MTILVTGSAGHLGEGLMRTLRAAGRSARGLDLKPSPWTDHVGSITDRDFLAGCLTGVRAVIHAATLHKPHVATHSAQAFIDTNVSGTLALLELAVQAGIEAFIFTSTTSTFGAGQRPEVWVTEATPAAPHNIYGVTKLAAESLCELFARKRGMPIVILRTSRFFPEEDDDPALRSAIGLENCQANELLYRRVDLQDAAAAHLLALERAASLGFARFIISATTPFAEAETPRLAGGAAALVEEKYPDCRALYAGRGWRLCPAIDRVYVNRAAREVLGWRPKHDFNHVLASLRAGEEFRSPLARQVGSKGYHSERFAEGPYPVS
jgi:UDP-glucose 4-epimerase